MGATATAATYSYQDFRLDAEPDLPREVRQGDAINLEGHHGVRDEHVELQQLFLMLCSF